MSKIIVGGGLVFSVALALYGCTIETCEEGAVCDRTDDAYPGGDGSVSATSQTDQCLNYCDRLSVCGAPQAKDFDACVKACKVRFDELPEQTAALCACMPKSRCEDALEGRCSDPDGAGGTSGAGAGGGSWGNGPPSSTGGGPAAGGTTGSGGSHSTGGSRSEAGAPAGGGHSTGGSSSSGGSHSTGGSSTTGGAPGAGGSANEAGMSCGASAGMAGEVSGGGAAGESAGIACTCDCQCTEPETCVDGYCAG